MAILHKWSHTVSQGVCESHLWKKRKTESVLRVVVNKNQGRSHMNQMITRPAVVQIQTAYGEFERVT